jgi:hypothetical protein
MGYVRLITYSEKLILVGKRLHSLWPNITPKMGIMSGKNKSRYEEVR